MAYVVDDQTVGGFVAGRPPASRIVEVDADVAWVEIGGTALLATEIEEKAAGLMATSA